MHASRILLVTTLMCGFCAAEDVLVVTPPGVVTIGGTQPTQPAPAQVAIGGGRLQTGADVVVGGNLSLTDNVGSFIRGGRFNEAAPNFYLTCQGAGNAPCGIMLQVNASDGSGGSNQVLVDASGSTIFSGATSSSVSPGQVAIGGGQIRTGGTIVVQDGSAAAVQVQGGVTAANVTVSRSTQATASEVVRGDDPRLTNARPASGGNADTIGGQSPAAFAPIQAAMPTGAVLPYAGYVAPSGWALCDGAAISRSAYPYLFGVIATTYGSGDGSTTFNVPDLRGRMIVGMGSGSGLSARSLGQKGGEENHTLSVAEMPTHSHDALMRQPGGSSGGDAAPHTTGTATPGVNASTGGSQPHNNMPPYIVINYIIKL